jgi:hypothetical protein
MTVLRAPGTGLQDEWLHKSAFSLDRMHQIVGTIHEATHYGEQCRPGS